MPLNFIKDNSIARMELADGSKASAEILLFGATVLSWKDDAGQERLFLSKACPLDGSTAVRGGVPLVFPVFGPPEQHPDNKGLEKLPKHGIARTSLWRHIPSDSVDSKTSDGEACAKASFALSSSEVKDLADKYQWSFDLIYDVILTAKKLELSLHISNTSSPDLPPMRFHALTHTYFKVPSAETCSIEGLGGQEYLDKTDGAKKKTLPAGESLVLHGKEHDAVYLGPTPKTLTLLYHPDQGKQGGGIEVVREDENTPQTVVWNIAEKEGAKMKDLHEGGWKEYICIEPGKVEGPQELEKGKKFTARQILAAL